MKIAVFVASGAYLPKGLTFGPTNGPEDFQELMLICFGRRLCRERYLFLDDLSVATGGRLLVHKDIKDVHDVWSCQEEDQDSEGQRRGELFGKFDPRLPSPYAQGRARNRRVEFRLVEQAFIEVD